MGAHAWLDDGTLARPASGACILSAMSTTLSRVLLEGSEHATKDLPIPPWAFGALAVVLFLVLLLLTWSFRHVGARYERELEGHGH